MKGRNLVALTLAIAVLTIGSVFMLTFVTAADPPRYGGTFTYEIYSTAQSFFPCLTTRTSDNAVGAQVFNSLLSYDLDFNALPDLATTWGVSSDGLTYTFTLVENAYWHDGEKFTSADVKFTIEEILVKYHPGGKTTFKNLASVEAPDDYTVIMKFSEPWNPVLTYMATHYAAIAPKHLYEGTDILSNPYNIAPIGTGPYVFKEFKPGEYIILERNPNYFKEDLPYLDTLIVKMLTDSQARVTALEKGEIDAMFTTPLWAYDQVSEMSGIVSNTPAGREASGMFIWLRFNPYEDVCEYSANKLVRQAIAFAIDVDVIHELAWFGYGVKATSVVNSKLPYHTTEGVEQYDYNPTKAEELLDLAGYPRGSGGTRFTIRLIERIEYPEHMKACALIEEWLEDVGINVQLEQADMTTGSQRVYFPPYDFDLYVEQCWAGPHPAVAVGRFLMSDRIGGGAYTNVGYNEPRYDELFALIGSLTDPVELEAAYTELQVMAADELPFYPLIEASSMVSWNEDFEAQSVLEDPWGPSVSMERVWYKGAHLYSPEEAQDAISDSEAKISELKDDDYDVSIALAKLAEAKDALAENDYTSAKDYADYAPALSIASAEGETGETGEAGEGGETGQTGPTGPTGPAGPAGQDASPTLVYGSMLIAIVALIAAAYAITKK